MKPRRPRPTWQAMLAELHGKIKSMNEFETGRLAFLEEQLVLHGDLSKSQQDSVAELWEILYAR